MSTYNITNQNGKNFIVFRLEAGEVEDGFVLGMLNNNAWKHCLPLQVVHMGETTYRYNIAGLMPLDKIYQDQMSKKVFLGVLEGIAEAALEAQEYMVDITNLEWDYKKIFVNQKDNSAMMICLPVVRDNWTVSVYQFFHDMIFHANLDMSENTSYHSELIQFINKNNEGLFSMEDILVLVRKLQSGKVGGQMTASIPPRPIAEPTPQASPNNSPMGFAQPVTPVKPATLQSTGKCSSCGATNKPGAAVCIVCDQKLGGNETPSDTVAEIKSNRKESGKIGFLDKLKGLKDTFGSKTDKNDSDAFDFELPGGDSFESVKPSPKENEKKSKETDTSNTVHSQPQVKPQAKPSPAPMPNPVNRPNRTIYVDDTPARSKNTTMIADDDGAEQRPYLIRKKTMTMIPLAMQKKSFRIGRDPGQKLELVLEDNPRISGYHAEITEVDGVCYIEDVNSSNGTFVDGQRIFLGTKVPLANGMIIRLANEDFEYTVQ